MNRATILMYHIIDTPQAASEAKYCCPASVFEVHMRYLAESGRAVGLPQLLDALDGHGECPNDAIAVTFDDGFTVTHEQALPILLRHGIPATMFLLSNRVAGHNDWMTGRGFPRRELMSREQMLEMGRAGVTLGSHTRNHARLREVDAAGLENEIAGSKAELEDLLGQEVAYFAYPFGQYTQAGRDMAEKAGYRAACSTRSGFNNSEVDRYQLRRIEVFGTDTLWRFQQKLAYGRNESGLLFPLQYYAGRLLSRIGF
ncbi:MAG: polysaccharide deacetylase family protein [Gammaproteobacteria bacterium]|nr:polysaccharide deacetylase family protein [Gammaproteobacteria bacterium]